LSPAGRRHSAVLAGPIQAEGFGELTLRLTTPAEIVPGVVTIAAGSSVEAIGLTRDGVRVRPLIDKAAPALEATVPCHSLALRSGEAVHKTAASRHRLAFGPVTFFDRPDGEIVLALHVVRDVPVEPVRFRDGWTLVAMNAPVVIQNWVRTESVVRRDEPLAQHPIYSTEAPNARALTHGLPVFDSPSSPQHASAFWSQAPSCHCHPWRRGRISLRFRTGPSALAASGCSKLKASTPSMTTSLRLIVPDAGCSRSSSLATEFGVCTAQPRVAPDAVAPFLFICRASCRDAAPSCRGLAGVDSGTSRPRPRLVPDARRPSPSGLGRVKTPFARLTTYCGQTLPALERSMLDRQ
jgi:hypothetical protein